jgi:small subunit ribosomal protein S21|tara:strand:- start:5444 stop:5743 length:300 start_codon:yes stop_codon:yes gene_type:complete
MQNYKRQQRNNYSNYSNHKRPSRNNRDNTPAPQGLQVFVREGEDINKALRKLKKKIERAGIMKEIRDRQYFQKPSEKRRKAKKAGIARWKKKQKEAAQF